MPVPLKLEVSKNSSTSPYVVVVVVIVVVSSVLIFFFFFSLFPGGCCPEGYICERGDNCRAPQGVSYSQSCPTNYFLCPSSLNYGCCRDGMGCASNACYSTEPSTYTLTRTVTITDSADEAMITTETETTVSTPSPPTATPTAADDDADVVIKFYPSSVSKVEPELVESDSDDDDDDDSDEGGGGGGLTTGHIVGIVIGAVALLVIVLLAAFLIMRRLNKVVKAVESKQGTTRDSNGTKTQTAYRSEKPTISELDDRSVDPLTMMMMMSTSSPRPCHHRADSDSDGIGIASPPRPTPSPSAHGGYQAVPTSMSSDRDDAHRDRHMSYDSTYPSSGLSYFDVVPSRPHRVSQQSGGSLWPNSISSATATATATANNRPSTDSQSTHSHGYAQGYGHVRHRSDGSDYSGSEVGNPRGLRAPPQELDGIDSSIMPELPADGVSSLEEAHRRSGTGGSMNRPTAPSARTQHARRPSNEGRGRSDSAAAAAQATLGVVAEQSEFVGHGHYGAPDHVAGDTAAGLLEESSREPSRDGRREV